MKSTIFLVLKALMTFIIIVSTGNLTLAVGHHKIFYLTNGCNSATIPFKLVENLIVIPVMLDGKKPLNFILDTGTSSAILFNRKYLEGLEVPMGRDISFHGAGNGKAVKGQVINRIGLHLSGAATDGIGMVVLDHNPFRLLQLEETPIHGLLGSVLFRSFVVAIDFVKEEIELIEHSTFIPTPDYASVSMEMVQEKPIIRTSLLINNTLSEVNLLVDTGFNNGLMLFPEAGSPYPMPLKLKRQRIGVGFSGGMTCLTGFIDRLQLGNQVVEQIFTIFPKEQYFQLGKSEKSIARHGTLGTAALKHFQLIFDYTSKKLYIKDKEGIPPSHILAQVQKESMTMQPH